MVDITRGDVLLCDLNPVVGTEQAGIRPVVVVQIDRANAVSPLDGLIKTLKPAFAGFTCIGASFIKRLVKTDIVIHGSIKESF